VTMAATAASSGGGGLGFLKWLIPLLFLLIPLFFLLRGCDGCGGDKTAVPAKTTSNEMKAVDTTKTTVAPPVKEKMEKEIVSTPRQACNCRNTSNRVFNISGGTPTKVINKLGTDPEFGNVHNLDPVGFYNKLKNAYATNARDKRFLDDMFKAMGYNGFGDADASQFSNATLTRGTNGNMGFNAKHRTVYAKLNTSGRDLEAFKIKAANGCDIHFMKTCGNHFFFCSK